MLSSEKLYIVIFCIAILSLLGALIIGIVSIRKRVRTDRWLKKHNEDQYVVLYGQKKLLLEKTNKRLKCCKVYFVVVLLLMFALFFAIQVTYAMPEQYNWSEEERGVNVDGENESLTFATVVRKYSECWWKDGIYYFLYESAFCDENGNFDGIIDREGMEYYFNKIPSIFTAERVQEDEIRNPDERPASFESDKSLFESAVGTDDADVTMLWEGFEAGTRVQEYNYTSQNVFQTGNLAERMHARICKGGKAEDQSIVCLAAMFVQYSLFLEFEELHVGEQRYLTIKDVLFREAKSSYNEGCYGVQEYDAKMHCVMMAYAIFSYLADETEKSDSKYLIYTYYSGHAFLYIMSEIDDAAYREELGREELGRWDGVVIEGSGYETENLKIDTILSAKEGLERAVGE